MFLSFFLSNYTAISLEEAVVAAVVGAAAATAAEMAVSAISPLSRSETLDRSP